MDGKKYKLIANPAAGRWKSGRLVSKVVEIFHRKGVSFDLEMTRGHKDASRIAGRSLDEFDVVVVIGGDGTVNDVIPAMIFSGKPLGIIPAGSGNDFIRSLRIPNNIEKAVDILLLGKTRVIDAGKINGWYFANAVGIGFDAAVNRTSYSINHSKRDLKLYFWALLKTLGKYRPVPVSISMNGKSAENDIFLLTAGNGTTVGGGFKLTPHARLDDQLLDVTIVKPIGVLPLLWHLPKVFAGTIDTVTKYASAGRTSKLIVESRQHVPVHVDGEIYGENETRFEIEVVPKALTVIGDWD